MKIFGLIFIFIINFLFFFKINAEEWVGACMPDYYPYNFFKDGKDLGIDTEIVKLVMKNLNIPFKIEYFPWARIMYLLENNKTTFAWQFVDTEERREKFNLVGPIRDSTIVFAVSKKSSIMSWNDLDDFKGKTVGVVRDFRYSLEFDSNKDIIKEDSRDVEILLNKVTNRRVDAIIGDLRTILYYIKRDKLSNKVRLLQKPVNILPRYVVFPKSEKEKSEQFQKSLDVILKSKKYQNIFKKYSPLP